MLPSSTVAIWRHKKQCDFSFAARVVGNAERLDGVSGRLGQLQSVQILVESSSEPG